MCFSIIHREDVQNQTIICANYSITQGFDASIMTIRQRTCLSAFVGMVEELSKWTSKEVAHSLPAKDRPSTLPARYALTPCSRHPIRHACAVSASHLSPALGKHGTATRLRQTLIVTA